MWQSKVGPPQSVARVTAVLNQNETGKALTVRWPAYLLRT